MMDGSFEIGFWNGGPRWRCVNIVRKSGLFPQIGPYSYVSCEILSDIDRNFVENAV